MCVSVFDVGVLDYRLFRMILFKLIRFVYTFF